MHNSTCKKREALREQIAADMAEYLAKGGTIKTASTRQHKAEVVSPRQMNDITWQRRLHRQPKPDLPNLITQATGQPDHDNNKKLQPVRPGNSTHPKAAQ